MTVGLRRMIQELQKREWKTRIRLIRETDADFPNLEDEDNRDAPLSNAGQPSHFDRIDTPTMETTAAYYRRTGVLSHVFPYLLDRKIAFAIADGVSYRHIKVRYRVGQSRIERIKALLNRWLPERYWGEQQAC